MTLDMHRPIKAIDARTGGTWVLPGKTESPNVRDCLIHALLLTMPTDLADPFDERILRFELLEKIQHPDPQDYSPKERDVLRERMGKVFDHIQVLGQLHRFLS